MHIPLRKTTEEKYEEQTSTYMQRKVSEYKGSIEQDKELMAIFERTYGKVNEEKKRNAFRSKKEREKSEVTFKGKPLPSGRSIFLWMDTI